MPTKQETWCVLLGMVMGVAIGGSFFWAALPKPASVSDFFNTWQTLIAGVLALLGAYLTVRAIRSQIMQADNLAEQGRLREERAERAILPLALSAFNQYADDCIALLDKYLPYNKSPVTIPADLRAPSLPTESIPTLRTCARYSDPQIVSQIAGVLGKLQVQHSRLEGMIARKRHKVFQLPEVLDALKDAADLHCAVNALYDYGRDQKAIDERASSALLASAIRTSGIWSKAHPIFKHLSGGVADDKEAELDVVQNVEE